MKRYPDDLGPLAGIILWVGLAAGTVIIAGMILALAKIIGG